MKAEEVDAGLFNGLRGRVVVECAATQQQQQKKTAGKTKLSLSLLPFK